MRHIILARHVIQEGALPPPAPPGPFCRPLRNHVLLLTLTTPTPYGPPFLLVHLPLHQPTARNPGRYSFQRSRAIPLPVRALGKPTEVKFVYQKDSGDTKYRDAVWLRNIFISGAKAFVEGCELCPPGTFQDDPQSNNCEACPVNTYSDRPGTVQCQDCDTRKEWAPEVSPPPAPAPVLKAARPK